MESQKTNDSHRGLKKDYSKLEKIFNNAVEKINQKKIIYYASDRLISDDSKRQFLRNTYKSNAWASPLTKEDIHTELINLDTNELVSLFPSLMEDKNSLISFLEITSDNEGIKEALKDNTLETQTQEVFHEEPDVKDKESEQDLSESTQDFLDWYYLRKKEIETNKQEEEPVDDLLINSAFLKNPVEEIKEEVKKVALKKSKIESSVYFSDLYNLSHNPKRKEEPVKQEDTLFELIKSIQEDDNFYNRKEPEKEKKLEEALTESTLVSPEVQETVEFEEVDFDSVEEIKEPVETKELVSETKENPIPYIIDETPQKTDIEFTTNEGKKESDLNHIVQTHERRVVFQNTEQKDFFFNESDKNEQVATPEKIAAAKKEYNISSIAFLISLILTGFYVYMIHADLYNFDYLAIVMIVIGIFGAWELDAKKSTIMVCIMLVIIAGFMGYRYFEYDRYLDVTHLLWLLLIPLNVISSYKFMNSRKKYSHLLHQGKRRRPIRNNSSSNESILFTTKDN